MTGKTELLAVEQRHREAAWPRRYQGAYAENGKAAWMSGRYDKADIIQAFARFELPHLARIAELEAALAASVASVRRNTPPYVEQIAAAVSEGLHFDCAECPTCGAKTYGIGHGLATASLREAQTSAEPTWKGDPGCP